MQNRQLTTALACVRLEAHKSLCITTMVFRSPKRTHDSYTPSVSSSPSRTSSNGALYRRSSNETIQSYKGSISNSSTHTTSTAATRKDLIDCLEQGPGGAPSISDRKSLYSLEKPRFHFRNQSQSTVGTIRDVRSVRNSTATSTSEQEIRPPNIPSFEDEDESSLSSTPRSSVYNLSTTLPGPDPSSSRTYGVLPSIPSDDPLTKPYGDPRPFATTEIPTADSENTPARHPLPPPTGRIAAFLSHIVPFFKEVTSSVSGTVTNHKVHDTSSPSAPPSRRASKITVEYHKPSRQSIQEYQDLLSNVNLHAAAAASYKDPFIPSRQAPPPPRPSRANVTNLADLYPDPNPTAVLGTAPKAPLEKSFTPTPVDRVGITSRSRGVTSSPSTQSSRRTSKITPEYHKPSRQSIQEYQELLSNVNLHAAAAANYKDPFVPSRQAPPPPSSHNASKPSGNQQKATFSVPPALPRSSRANATNLADLYADPNPTAVLGTAPKAPLNGLPGKSSSTAPVDSMPKQRSAAVASLAKAPDATPRRRGKKKINKSNDADIVRRLQQICTNADPTQFYRNLVKIGQGQG